MEISQRKEAFENELVSIEKKLTGDLDKNIVPKEENEKHDQVTIPFYFVIFIFINLRNLMIH